MESNREVIERTAAAWIGKRDAGEWTTADQAQLDGWMKASASHAVEFLRLDSAWREAARLRALRNTESAGAIPSREALNAMPLVSGEDRGVASGRSFVLRRWAIAAMLTAAVALSAAGYFALRAPSYSTNVGGLEGISMVDGSHVTLNTNSQVRIAVTDRERRIDLKRGEAFFEVAKDSQRPFVVIAGGHRVVAIGTRFSVWRTAEGTRVVVSEGKVRFEPHSGGGPVDLIAGSVARTGPDGVRVQSFDASEVERFLSWRSGFVTFLETPLAEAVAEFNRYNEQQMSIEDPALAGLKIDGSFRTTNVNAFVRLLEGGFPVKAERVRGKIVVQARH